MSHLASPKKFHVLALLGNTCLLSLAFFFPSFIDYLACSVEVVEKCGLYVYGVCTYLLLYTVYSVDGDLRMVKSRYRLSPNH